jgi:hypothetical protein
MKIKLSGNGEPTRAADVAIKILNHKFDDGAGKPLEKAIKNAVSSAYSEAQNGGRGSPTIYFTKTHLVRVQMHTVTEWTIDIYLKQA